MVKRGEYRPPNEGGSNDGVFSLFDDPSIAWPKRAHWWHYVEENETFALWVLNTAAGALLQLLSRRGYLPGSWTGWDGLLMNLLGLL
jgi:hypothetical protein